jgi:hypothetical protein
MAKGAPEDIMAPIVGAESNASRNSAKSKTPPHERADNPKAMPVNRPARLDLYARGRATRLSFACELPP